MSAVDIICSLEKYVVDFVISLLDEKKKKILSKGKIIDITRLFYIIQIVLINIKNNIYTTLRQIFYINPKLFISQRNSNKIIGKLTKIIKKSREQINIYNAPKGIIRGNILLKEKKTSNWIDCMNVFELRGHLISPFGVENINISSGVQYILIIEKETIFYKLLQSNYISTYGPTILITAKGFPDINTRQLLFEIQKRHRGLKIFCLTDYDVYGLSIACTYASKNESKIYYVDDMSIENLEWLILFTPEEGIKKNVIKNTDLTKLTLKDIRILDNICAKLKNNKKYSSAERNNWIENISNMKKFGVKYEIDAINDIEKHINNRIKELL
ncbi:meiotic recombination protein SPO11, putative [Plasmodium sp. gorilla clade G2]|uniref:meiotic recombination protein SPO11, putative n=1 Tax=Plasmodium sp. gorilla clade G2 TaxID=880535 RepID=UPI000D202FA5|nr:meiotic recombination protein SPO11, putative [Plasmodium sp. gorilla clade G2]SOV16771.1 meiotic recombination protein SPO11, putative [Plasmodium sp. gorilla clade G2]